MVQVHERPASLHNIHSGLIGKRFSHIPTLYMSPSARSACFYLSLSSPHPLNQRRPLWMNYASLKMHLWAQPLELF